MSLEEAWSAVHDATPRAGMLAHRRFREYQNRWEMFAFDTNDRGRPGRPRTRQWTAVGASELEVLQEMARCLEVVGRGSGRVELEQLRHD